MKKKLYLLKNVFFFTAITFFSHNALNVSSLESVLMKNQECKTRSETINVNTKLAYVLSL